MRFCQRENDGVCYCMKVNHDSLQEAACLYIVLHLFQSLSLQVTTTITNSNRLEMMSCIFSYMRSKTTLIIGQQNSGVLWMVLIQLGGMAIERVYLESNFVSVVNILVQNTWVKHRNHAYTLLQFLLEIIVILHSKLEQSFLVNTKRCLILFSSITNYRIHLYSSHSNVFSNKLDILMSFQINQIIPRASHEKASI